MTFYFMKGAYVASFWAALFIPMIDSVESFQTVPPRSLRRVESTASTVEDTLISSTTSNQKPLNAIWPSGISDDDVEHLVEEVMQDSTIALRVLPNSIERQVYRSTIKLCWNAIYQFLGDFQGKQLFGHEFQLSRWKARENTTSSAQQKQQISEQYRLLQGMETVDEVVLELVARRLLDNKAINQRFLPDMLERKLYVTCLKLIFRLLAMIAASLRLVVCGHEVRLNLAKAATVTTSILTPSVQRVASSMTYIDKARLKEFAIQAGIQEHEIGEGQHPDDSTDDSKRMNWIERMVERRRRALLMQIHAALFALILGILDDLLANTAVDLLSDRITFDIIPAGSADASTAVQATSNAKRIIAQRKQRTMLQRFWTGLCVGLLTVMALFGAR